MSFRAHTDGVPRRDAFFVVDCDSRQNCSIVLFEVMLFEVMDLLLAEQRVPFSVSGRNEISNIMDGEEVSVR